MDSIHSGYNLLYRVYRDLRDVLGASYQNLIFLL